MKSALIFTLFFVLLGALALPYQTMGMPLWPVVIMTIFASTWFGRIERLRPYQIGLSAMYLGLFGALWLKSFPSLSITAARGWAWLFGMFIFASVAALAGLIVFLKADRDSRGTLVGALSCIFCGAMIALLSGSAGGAAPFIQFLLSQGLAINWAELVNITFRKSVHLGFYGFFAVMAFRTARLGGLRQPIVASLIFVMAHSVFDEVRQWGVPDRTGSPFDVLIDLIGVLAFLAWANKPYRVRRA
ncbi:MAG: VanZ family protein [Fimbriimonadaceae bacterium]